MKATDLFTLEEIKQLKEIMGKGDIIRKVWDLDTGEVLYEHKDACYHEPKSLKKTLDNV